MGTPFNNIWPRVGPCGCWKPPGVGPGKEDSGQLVCPRHRGKGWHQQDVDPHGSRGQVHSQQAVRAGCPGEPLQAGSSILWFVIKEIIVLRSARSQHWLSRKNSWSVSLPRMTVSSSSWFLLKEIDRRNVYKKKLLFLEFTFLHFVSELLIVMHK